MSRQKNPHAVRWPGSNNFPRACALVAVVCAMLLGIVTSNAQTAWTNFPLMSEEPTDGPSTDVRFASRRSSISASNLSTTDEDPSPSLDLTNSPTQPFDSLPPPTCGVPSECEWDWRLLPQNLIYPSYWAAPKEPRFGGLHFFNENDVLIQEGQLGARFGLLRYGTGGNCRPEGFQWDVEGVANPRLLPASEYDLQAIDFRIGTDWSIGVGPWQMRMGYYHLSSHAGDEYLLKHPWFERINYKRETILWGISNYPTDWARLYFECGYAGIVDGGSKPWELIFGADLGPTDCTGLKGAPYGAVSAHLRQEIDFKGDFVAQVGWMWRDRPFGHVFRVGFQYLTGYNPQYEFYSVYEQQYGIGLWYDF